MNRETYEAVTPFPEVAELYEQLIRIKQKDQICELYELVCRNVEADFFYDCDQADNQQKKWLKDKILPLVPELSLFIVNMHPGAAIQVEALIKKRSFIVDFTNISDFKRELREQYDLRWNRDMSKSESQGSVSVLGKISEELLKRAIETITVSDEIFQTNQDDTKSYGDFVLLSLPNNLWFSVKSGYSRERLLASGFSNDLVGVGFFEDSKEFTSQYKIRNFKKSGFLAIYLPDVAVTKEQVRDGTSTFAEVETFYTEEGRNAPLNINGTLFFRPLSSLGDDITGLLDEPIQRRSTLKF